MRLYGSIIYLFVLWSFILLIISYIGILKFSQTNFLDLTFAERLANWDGAHYMGIAKNGYSESFQYAFFPFYPLSIRLFNYFFSNYLFTSLLLSFVSSFLAIQLFYKLLVLEFNKALAEKSVIWLLIFPTSFYLLTVYSEGMFLFLTIACFYFSKLSEHKNKKFNLILATFFAILASATRVSGVVVSLSLAFKIYLTEGVKKDNWFVVLSPLGSIVYFWYLFSQTGDLFYFIAAQKHWLRVISVPGLGFWETIKQLAQPGFLQNNFNALLDLSFAIFGAGMVIRGFRFLPPWYAMYGLGSILLPLFTTSLSSMPRFLLPIFPIFILMALWKNKFLIFFFQIISTMLLAAFVILFVNGFWVS